MVGGGEADSESRRAARRHRLEIIHESLLTQWPRLVRWQAQDAEGAVLRDQLRQAAQLWEQRGRAADFLWTGTAYREYQLWRERYPGGLTALEEAFAGATTALAQRRRRRRQFAVTAVIVVLATGLAVVAVLRQQAVAQTRRAEAEARRAEASKLLALGQLELEGNHTAALAYAIKSLELDDSHAARVFAMKALAAGPPGQLDPVFKETGTVNGVAFSPDGAWAAVVGSKAVQLVRRDGRSRRLLEPFPTGPGSVVFDQAPGHRAAKDGVGRVWRAPRFESLETQIVGGKGTQLRSTRSGVIAVTRVREGPREHEIAALVAGSPTRPIAWMRDVEAWAIDRAGSTLAFASGKVLYVRSLARTGQPARQVGTYEGQPRLLLHPEGEWLAVHDGGSPQIRLWALESRAPKPVRALDTPFESLSGFTVDPAGGRLAAIGTTPKGLRVAHWALEAPPDAMATGFSAPFGGFLRGAAFSPDGRWLATANYHAACFWPLARREPRVIGSHRVGVIDVRFTPDGGRVVSIDQAGEVREWPLGAGATSRTLARVGNYGTLDVDRRGRFVAVARPGGAAVVPLGAGQGRVLQGFAPATGVGVVAIDRDGRRIAAASISGPKDDKVIRVWDLETNETQVLGPTEQAGEGMAGQTFGLGFLPDGSLVSSGHGGLRRWSFPGGSHEVLAPAFQQSHLAVSRDGHSAAYVAVSPGFGGRAVSLGILDLTTRATRVLGSHGGRVLTVALDPSGTIAVSGGLDGIVRVGPVTGEVPHLLLGHQGLVHTVDVSPDGRWIASAGDDRAIHIWPMPDLSRPPLHTLPHDELLARLKSMTNVRVVEESKSTISAWLRTDRGTGYELDLEPFRGWAQVPEW